MSATRTLSNPCTSNRMGSSNPVGETEWLQIADKHGFPGIVARATLDAPDVEQILEGHARYKNVRGIRHA